MKLLVWSFISLSLFFVHADEPTGPDFRLHEWGTFTTVSGSDGVLLPGLDRDEELLPNFVSGQQGLSNQLAFQDPVDTNVIYMLADTASMFSYGKTIPWASRNVTVKMETPVIYVYSDTSKPFPLEVTVGFEKGLISQVYPWANMKMPPMTKEKEAVAGTPFFRSKSIDFSQAQNGRAQWMLNVLPKQPSDAFRIIKKGESATWIRPRVREANVLSDPSGYMKEGFVFYRGLGNFDIPLKTRMDEQTLSLSSEQDLSYALVYQTDGYRAKVLWDGPVAVGETHHIEALADTAWRTETPIPKMQLDLLTRMQTALVEEGLSADESSAMLQTWWDSYFCHAGLRVFWMVPRAMTDEVLPITTTPAPKSMERVLIGRSEVLLPSFEAGLPAALAKAGNHLESDRYFAAYRARAMALQPRLKLPADPYMLRYNLRRVVPGAAPEAVTSLVE